MPSLSKRERIDAGLRQLCEEQKNLSIPRDYSLEEIAEACGCSKRHVQKMTEKALAKMHVRLRSHAAEAGFEVVGPSPRPLK